MATTILVTGAAGFAGSHLLDLLARYGADDVVAWQRPGSPTPAAGGRTRWESVDVLDAGAVRDAIARVRPHLVYHCAGAAHVGRRMVVVAVPVSVRVAVVVVGVRHRGLCLTDRQGDQCATK